MIGNQIADQTEGLNLAASARRIGELTGHTPSGSTILRWCLIGIRGVSIPYQRCGRRICIRAPDLERFVEALHEADRGLTNP